MWLMGCRLELLLLIRAVQGLTSDGQEDCIDRDEKWEPYGSSCVQVKGLCEDASHGRLVRAWCPLTCGLCTLTKKNETLSLLKNITFWTENETQPSWPEFKAVKGNVSQNASRAPRSNGSIPGPQGSDVDCGPGCANRSASGAFAESSWLTMSNTETEQPAPRRKKRTWNQARILSENVSTIYLEASSGNSSTLSRLLSSGRKPSYRMSSASEANVASAIAFTFFTSDMFSLSGWPWQSAEPTEFLANDSNSEGYKIDWATALRIKQSGAATTSEQEKQVCPKGYERVSGHVYGGDQWSGSWRDTAPSIQECALRCSGTPGCGSFEYNPVRKLCFRNSQTRATHEEEQADFLLCRRTPCPSFKSEAECIGPNVPSGHYSAEVAMRPGSYCIWSGNACQAPMACTPSDCFLPDGGLPGMDLPPSKTLWISAVGLRATFGTKLGGSW